MIQTTKDAEAWLKGYEPPPPVLPKAPVYRLTPVRSRRKGSSKKARKK